VFLQLNVNFIRYVKNELAVLMTLPSGKFIFHANDCPAPEVSGVSFVND
jgi:hypothetical protein